MSRITASALSIIARMACISSRRFIQAAAPTPFLAPTLLAGRVAPNCLTRCFARHKGLLIPSINNAPLIRLAHSSPSLLTAAASSFKTDSDGAMPPAPSGQRMILTDAMALLYRSHFAFSPEHRLRNAAGLDTTVIFGFLSTVLSLLELTPPATHFVAVFDASGKTFRHEMFPGYKGQRPDAPEEVRAAVPVLKEILAAMGVAEVCVPGVEADDVIGTLAVRGVEEGMAVAIASPDKDFFQLLRPGLILLRPPKKADAAAAHAEGRWINKYALLPYTEDEFSRDWGGLAPSQFVDVLALMGDSSDNVPGVAGIGPKTATALLLEHGTLENVIANADKAKPKRAAEMLSSVEGAAAARLSRQLVELRTRLDLPPTQVPLDEFRLAPPVDGGVAALQHLSALEFKVHVRRLQELWQRRGWST